MQIRVVCHKHQSPVQIEGANILFPADKLVAAKDPNGWMDLDMSEMYCPLARLTEGDEDLCSDTWKWELRI
jgi:hypothetical protein